MSDDIRDGTHDDLRDEIGDEVRDDPWWASGSEPGDGIGDEDPLDRHAAGRRGAPSGEPRNGRAAGDGPHGRRLGGGAWWHDAVDALADAARAAGESRAHQEGPSDGERDAGTAGHATGEARVDGHVCQVCPVCVALRALDESRPEVVAHLSEALRHVSLAARAFVEAQVAATGGDDGLHRVDLDDE